MKEGIILNVGNLIKEFRKKNNLTQTDFGKMIGVNKQTVSKWENGVIQPSTKKFYEIAQAVGASASSMINNEENEEDRPFIFAHRSQYDVGLNSVYRCIHNFESFCVFIDLLGSAHHLLEPHGEIIGFLLVDMTFNDPESDEEAIPINSIFFDGKNIVVEILNYTLDLTKENISSIEGAGFFNNEVYAINIYMKKKDNSNGFLQLLLGFHNNAGDE